MAHRIFHHDLHGSSSRAWFLGMVRNRRVRCDWMKREEEEEEKEKKGEASSHQVEGGGEGRSKVYHDTS